MRYTLTPILFLALTLTACEGPEGPPGRQGVDGEPGPAGPPGSTNVKTATFTIRSGDFQGSSDSDIESAAYSASIIMREIASGGAVLAYTDATSGTDAWIALPLTMPISMGLTVEFTYGYVEGAILLMVMRPSGYGPVASTLEGSA